MFFSAYNGSERNLAEWKDLVLSHAGWLNFYVQFESRDMENGSVFAFAWIKHHSKREKVNFVETPGYVVINTSGDFIPKDGTDYKYPWACMKSNVDKNIIQVGASLLSSEVRVLVPLTNPEQFYFSHDYRGIIFGNDMRLILKWTGLDLDERGVYSLFKYRSIPAPYTISKNVFRIPNGHVLKYSMNESSPTVEAAEAVRNYIFTRDESVECETVELENILDGILENIPSSSGLFFSGGVDSSLLALRLSEIGRKDVKLVNFSYGKDDPNGIMARDVANYLKSPFEQIQFDDKDALSMLDNIYRDYSYPFSDPATIPANILSKKTGKFIDNFSLAVDGSGSDCSFVGDIPVYAKYRNFIKIPFHLRVLMSELYKKLKLWNYDSKIVAPFRASRRSVLIPIQTLEIGNIFDDVFYSIPEKIKDKLKEAYFINTQAFYVGLYNNPDYNDFTYTSIINLIYDAANNSASKTFDPLRHNGVKLLCPFLEPKLLNFSFSIPWEIKESEESKWLLKKMLLSKIPKEIVYQKKGIFCPPYSILTNVYMKEFIYDIVLSDKNPIAAYFNKKMVREIVQKASKDYIDPDLFAFIWSLVFLSGWVYQLKNANLSSGELVH